MRPLTPGCRLDAPTTRSSRPSPRKRGEGTPRIGPEAESIVRLGTGISHRSSKANSLYVSYELRLIPPAIPAGSRSGWRSSASLKCRAG